MAKEIMTDYSLIDIQQKVIGIASDIAKEYNLNLRSITFVSTDQFYGQCSIEGDLKIKLTYSDGEKVPLMEVWRTLGHEMAHLRHFNHGDAFWEFNRELVNKISEKIGKRIRPEIAILSNKKVVC